MDLIQKDSIYKLLSQIPDPEIPVINIEELGILRDVEIHGQEVVVTITPTYTGCPAMQHIEDEVKNVLKQAGYSSVKVLSKLSPPWTTDWITESAKKKLLASGISPPAKSTEDKGALTGKPKRVVCPLCKSEDTTLLSQFGSTACKALYRCNSCLEPFDYFKCI